MGGHKCCWHDCKETVNKSDGTDVAIPYAAKRSKYKNAAGDSVAVEKIKGWRKQWLKACGLDVDACMNTEKLRLYVPQTHS